MITKVSSALILLLLNFTLSGQEAEYKNYNWNEIPSFPRGEQAEKIILKNFEQVEFIFEGEYFTEYQTRHIVEFINSDEQIEANNQKYIPFEENAELIEAKIRVIKPDSQIILMDESKILTSLDEITKRNYKYFALEGLEPGSIIDYFYVMKKYPSYNGVRRYIQDEFPTREYRFELYCPPHLIFAFKVYNDSLPVVQDTTKTEKNLWVYSAAGVDGLKNEESSPYYTMLKQLVYKFDANSSNQTTNQSSFWSASTSIYNQVYSPLDKNDTKALSGFLKNIGLDQDLDTEEKIAAIENYTKDNINIVSGNDEKYNNIASIVKLKSATEMGIIRLLVRLFEAENIKLEVLLTCDRTNLIFDKDFESYYYLTDYLFYFPETGRYLSPDKFEYRFGLIPWEFTDNYGLFVKETQLGEFKTGIGKVKYIPAPGYDASAHTIDARATIAEDLTSVDLDLLYSMKGQYAVSIQPYYNLLSDDIKEEFMTDHFREYFPGGEIKEWNVENGEAGFVGKEPFILHYIATTTDLIDKAGNSYLFKVGKLIGPQVEMYSESERRLPVNDRYKRSFDRTLEIEIPAGYTVKNIADLEVRESYVKDGQEVLLFESKYELDGNTITIVIHEYYDQINYELSEFENYRIVVNSAADFEKIVLVLQAPE
jgi:hypothetical protein